MMLLMIRMSVILLMMTGIIMKTISDHDTNTDIDDEFVLLPLTLMILMMTLINIIVTNCDIDRTF